MFFYVSKTYLMLVGFIYFEICDSIYGIKWWQQMVFNI